MIKTISTTEETMLGDKTGAERERLKKAYENGFKAIIAYDDAQS